MSHPMQLHLPGEGIQYLPTILTAPTMRSKCLYNALVCCLDKMLQLSAQFVSIHFLHVGCLFIRRREEAMSELASPVLLQKALHFFSNAFELEEFFEVSSRLSERWISEHFFRQTLGFLGLFGFLDNRLACFEVVLHVVA